MKKQKIENRKISIIVPVYNAEKWLEDCIKSVLNQTYKNVELVLVNDGSDDSSDKICKKYSLKYSNIKYILQENAGASVARNKGLKNATGSYIQFLDSDDYLNNDCCEKMIDKMKSENCDLVLCGMNIWKNGELLRTPHLQEKVFNVKENINNYKFLHPIFASPCNKIFKKELIDYNFDSNKSLGEDLTFNLEYLKRTTKVATISECLYNVRLDNDHSLNRKFRSNRMEIMLELNDIEKQFCEEVYEKQDISFAYNQYILSYHYYFKEITSLYSRKKCIQLIKKYINDDRIKIAVKKCNLQKKYYKLFVKILSIKNSLIIYWFLKLRKAIENLILSK